MDDVVRNKESLEDLGVFIDGVTETEKHKIKKTRRWIFLALLAPLAASLVEAVISSVVRDTSVGGVRRAGRGYMDKIYEDVWIYEKF